LDTKRYKQRLLGIENQLTRRLGHEGEGARNAAADQADAGDMALADELKDESLAAADADSTTLDQVRDALRRIDAGTYGKCAVDGKPIPEQRLDALPWTPYCAEHERIVEAREGRATPSL
jgi:RNA polymerase-binding transcription factor DksA